MRKEERKGQTWEGWGGGVGREIEGADMGNREGRDGSGRVGGEIEGGNMRGRERVGVGGGGGD